MRVVVVGAGIIGVCTAYALRRAGFDVTVLERRSGVAQETRPYRPTLTSMSAIVMRFF